MSGDLATLGGLPYTVPNKFREQSVRNFRASKPAAGMPKLLAPRAPQVTVEMPQQVQALKL